MSSEKYSAKKPWWRNPSTIGDVVAVIAAFLAILLTILDILNLLEIGWFKDNLIKFTLLLVSLVVVSDVVERRFLTHQLQGSILDEINRIKIGPYHGVENVFANREQLPPFADMIESGKQEIFIAGIEFGYIALQQLPTLEQKANFGCEIRLLMVNPGSKEEPNPLINMLQETFEFPQLGDVLLANLNRILHWKSTLPNTVRQKIEVRVTNSVPTHIVTFVDKNHSSGKMLLEMLPPNIDVRDRWLVKINAQNGGDLYRNYVKAYDLLWKKAQLWESAG